MLFGGLQKVSLIDYPGTVSCVLFVAGCNFECPYCHNPELVKGNFSRSLLIDKNAVYDFLKSRKELVDGVVISGGEPTIQKDLIRLCEEIKKMGYPIKLDTNGSRPHVLKQLIKDKLVDYIATDIKTDPFRYRPLITTDFSPDDLLSSIQIIMESGVEYEFRTTCVKPIINANIIKKISVIIKGATLYALQPFHNSKVLHPEFFRGNEAGYSEDELLYLKSIAAPWVEKCIVRS